MLSIGRSILPLNFSNNLHLISFVRSIENRTNVSLSAYIRTNKRNLPYELQWTRRVI